MASERRKVVKNTTQRATKILCDNLQIDDLLRTLLAEGALKRNQVEKIKAAPLDPDKVDALLQILATNVQSYDIFMTALKDERKDLYNEVKGIEDQESDTEPIKYDVMISYQWDAQKRMILLKSKLEAAGFNVWMDIAEIEGHINDKMAEGVEQSKAILLCISRKYFDSQNCKKEANFADKLKKKIIPLKYESGYDPKGWLGLILGDICYYDVSSDQALSGNIDAIKRAINSAKKQD